MVHSNALLWKKGPVHTVWKASFCKESELSRDKVAGTDIVASVGNDSVSTPAMREKPPFFFSLSVIGLLDQFVQG
jgi:hypothetical protein